MTSILSLPRLPVTFPLLQYSNPAKDGISDVKRNPPCAGQMATGWWIIGAHAERRMEGR